MSAQDGASIVLAYRPRPAAAQIGGGVVLEYELAALGGATIRSGWRAPWSVSRAERRRAALRVAPIVTGDAARGLRWAVAVPRVAPTLVPWGVADSADGHAATTWGEYAAQAESDVTSPWGATSPADRAAAGPWGQYTGQRSATAAPSWRNAYPADDVLGMPWGEYRPRARMLVAVLRPTIALNPASHLPWLRYSRPLNPGWGVVIDDGNPPTDEHGTVIVPVLEYYLVANEFTLIRADTGEPVEVENFSASLDLDSWCWGWSASLPASLMPLVRSPALGEHVELIATLNGTPLRLVVERMARDRRFGASMLRISGRSRAAWLADPHAPIATRYNTAAYTAQQLLADALTVNGVSIGWSLDWRIADWLVPAGAWSHTGTYMDAATRIAEAGGGYVQAHDTDQTLIVLPRYPSAPWNWAAQTPDIELPEDVCEVEGIEWQDKPAYNAVWITGGESGRRDRIRRAGTAADRTAPTLVDPLATAPEMTRARGLAVLADTGRQAHISLRLPVLPETGVIRPGKLVRYTEGGNTHLGLTRAVQLEQRFPDLWQTIKVETHELESI